MAEEKFAGTNIILRVIGDRSALSEKINKAIDHAIEITNGNTGIILNMALNYGGQDEIVRAARIAAEAVKNGEMANSAEAQACGTPAIVYNATACPEVARLGKGYVCEPRNVEQAYSFLQEISNIPLKERENLRVERAKLMKDIVSKETRIEYLYKLYKKALDADIVEGE